jgi:hypothetical protein
VPMEVPLAFLNAPAPDVSLAAHYGALDQLPSSVRTFGAKPFWCPTKQAVVALPNLDRFFFDVSNDGPMFWS